MNSGNSLITRLIVAGILIPIILLFVFLGGVPYLVFILIFMACAGWEFWRIFRVGNYYPSLFLILVGIVSIILMRYFWQFQYTDLWLTVLVLLALAFAVFQQAASVPHAGFNYAITIGGILFVGWLGSYAISLRNMPLGLPWLLLSVLAAAMTDTGAYLFGSLFGKHKIAPALSPKKSWEGYFGGVIVGALSTWLGALLLANYFPGLNPVHGLILGIVLGVLTPMGDFAESMFKRLFNLKDTSHLLPGHGGILDRLDSSLWAISIGFYIITFLI
jgi:phosphatidate cytidylyltransferase